MLALQSPTRRKATGAYYTPAPLVDLLLTHALSPLIDKSEPPLKILDPACGPGDFLAATHTRLKNHAKPHFYAVDIDNSAIDRCTTMLLASDLDPNHLHIQTADALLDPPDFLAPQSFDLILGNPPYINGIERNLTSETKSLLREKFPAVRGAADLSHYFLEQSNRLIKPGGRIAFVLPRSLLNSPAAKSFRATLPPYLRPNLIYAPDRCDFFPGASIYICLLILGPDSQCQFSTDHDPATAQFKAAPITTDNWWLALQQSTAQSPAIDTQIHPSLSSQFQITGSMTTGDAYDLVPHLIDNENAQGLKLATTGLIEPRESLWGRCVCRYLKKDYRHPRINISPALTRSLSTRTSSAATRPKIIVAGLTRKLEAFLDLKGEYIGAVSTFTIYHPQNDQSALTALLDHLLAPSTSEYLFNHLGANGMRGQHITLKKSFLQNLPLPPQI